MADDIVFDLLHSEIINHVLDQSKDNVDKKVVTLFHLQTFYKPLKKCT